MSMLVLLNHQYMLQFLHSLSNLSLANGGLSDLVNFLGPEHNRLGTQMNL